jgi:hypothetical protein
MWEGQLCLAVKDGNLWFLFENKGNLYNDRGFEMLAAFTQHCHPNSVANAFTSLLLLLNDVQGNDKPILQYLFHFDRILMELSWCKVAIPQILLVMLILCAIPNCYLDLLEQFCTHFKSIKTATINSIVSDIEYHDGFTIHECKGTKPPASAPCVPAAASANTYKRVQSGIHRLSGYPSPTVKRRSKLGGLGLWEVRASVQFATARTNHGTIPTFVQC